MTLAICLGIRVEGMSETLPQVHPKAKRDFVAVLMWHDVVTANKEVWFDTTVAELKAQFAAIKRRGCSVISLETLYRHLVEGTPVPPRSLVLTFDDNNRGLYENAFPLLNLKNKNRCLVADLRIIKLAT